MRKVVLFIAMSLDGFIAGANGGVDWLRGQADDAETEDTYSAFVKTVDTTIMGWTTYHQVRTELSPSEWVYGNLMTYVVTHREQASTENIRFVHESPSELVRRLQNEDGQDIWVCGGASVVQQLMEDGLIDRFHLSIIPTILGSGIRLFGPSPAEARLKLLENRNSNGIIEVIYENR